MDDSFYKREEKERDINKAKQLHTQKRSKMKERGGKLLAEVNRSKHVVTEKDIRALAKMKYKQPVISFYLNIDPEKLLQGGNLYLTYFNSLKTKAGEIRDRYLANLDHQAREGLKNDLAEMEKYLDREFDATGIKSLVWFKSGKEVSEIYRLSVPTTDRLSIDSDPYLLPLQLVWLYQKRVLVAEMEKNFLNMSHYYQGIITKLRGKTFDLKSETVNAGRPAKVQRHRQDELDKVLKQEAAEIDTASRKNPFDLLVIMGNEKKINELLPMLSEPIQKKVAAKLVISPERTEATIGEAVEQVLKEYQKDQEKKYMDELSELKADRTLVSGMERVVEAVNQKSLRLIIFDRKYQLKGYVCVNDHFLSLQPGDCPRCNQALQETENILEEIAQIMDLTKTELVPIEYETEKLDQYDAILGVNYFSGMNERIM